MAVLLVSPHFLASSFIAERELPVILQRARSGSLRVVWLPLALGHEALVAKHPELAALQGGLGYALALRRVFLRLATAIARAHALGISYGNLKPSNIFLDDSFEPFILPVGRRRDPARERQSVLALLARLQGCAQTGSTPRPSDQEDLCYLVPEHFGEQIDEVQPQLADQYMLGVLTYEMVTGARPVLLPQPQHLLADGRHAFVALPPVALHRRLCPQRLGALVARMAHPDPAQRHPRLAEVLQEPDLQDDLNLVIARDSYRRCAQAPGFDDQFFARFYANFLRSCPDAAPFFARFAPGDWARQHRMLKEAVLLLFAFAQQQGGLTEPNLLSRTAASHRHIPAALYAPFLDALVLTVCGDEAGSSPPADPACQQRETALDLARYWQRALAPGIAYLQGTGQRPA